MSMRIAVKNRLGGFTLIELMIVVVVISILAAIALPSYRQQTVKAKRAEGKTALIDAAQKMERYYTDNASYTTALAPFYFGAGSTATVYSGNNHTDTSSAYVITAAVAGTPASSYTLTATQNGSFSDPTCGNLTLTNTGVKGITGTGTVKDCW